MKKFRFSLVFLLVLAASVHSSRAQESKPRHAPDILPGVEPEMLTPGYWIGLQDEPDKLIMTAREIEQFDENVRHKSIVFRDYYGKQDPLIEFTDMWLRLGLLMNPILPLDLPGTVPGDSLRVWLKKNIDFLFSPADLWGSRDFYDGRNAIYNDTMKQELAERMNVDAIPQTITRLFGIIVNHANLRYYPTEVPGYHNTVNELDRFQGGSLLIGMPVAVLHKSLDGDYLYVETPVSRGWVRARDVALDKRTAIRALAGDKNFLMAAGDKVPVYGDPAFRNFARYFYFSATMSLIKHGEKGYVVRMPYRKEDGSLGISNGYVKPDADVHIGYFPYTKRNVLNQIFKLLDTPYGWEDQNNKRDCCGAMWVLLRCFGIVTGRVPQFILMASDHRVYIDPALSTEDNMAETAKIEPVITMAGTSGHIVLYLGKARNGMFYYMHQCGWGYRDENGNDLIVKRLTINAADHPLYDIHQPKVYATFKL